MKAVIITLPDIPETELDKEVTVTIGEHTYTGKVSAIIAYISTGVASVTLEGVGLKVAE